MILPPDILQAQIRIVRELAQLAADRRRTAKRGKGTYKDRAYDLGKYHAYRLSAWFAAQPIRSHFAHGGKR
jgi:hypothetical protein